MPSVLTKVKSTFLITLDFAADSATLVVAAEWFQIIYCTVELASNIRLKLKHFETRHSRFLSTWQDDFLLADKVKPEGRDITDENVEAPHNCDWTATIHVVKNNYLEWMLLLLHSDYGVMKKTSKFNHFEFQDILDLSPPYQQ